ncbi:FliH/SctL family protein [Oscillospiraceae bacterium 42-9]|uniref:FliH/SctL family protein n=1 Tax=Acutalibacter sp. TaxID=1918636 RepID=UPI00216E084C|nr:F0F1 ATP synthase subunit delta [Acutalibacter sp.]
MPGIFKRFANVSANKYVFPDAEDLAVSVEEPAPVEPAGPEASPVEEAAQPKPEPEQQEPTPIDFAQVQANAILQDAREEAEAFRAKALGELEKELDELRERAKKEGYELGYAQGIAEGRLEAQRELDEKAAAQEKEISAFLKDAVRARDQLLEDSKQDLKELALAIAEKVIRVSLKSSGDILIRMIESATAKRRRCEWVQIYIADCDARASANTVPELAEALSRLSDRVRIIPMADDESGTCIIEMPDEILDVSVSTQLDNLRGILSNAEPDSGRIQRGWP